MPTTVPPLRERQQPGLSETLAHTRDPNTCQSCGDFGLDRGSGRRWIECDAFDEPTATMVILCVRCSERLIERHPRLYLHEDWWAPRPGAMACCVDCTLRTDLRCVSPMLKARGGPGLGIRIHPLPGLTILCGRGCKTIREYGAGPDCDGKCVLGAAPDPQPGRADT